ncbi:MAG: hypothetical protein JW800_07665 [Candidatus Omnitrophica bacterium]|nr:hypothetical protein [Candidatus Omnitrophota bacterium]
MEDLNSLIEKINREGVQAAQDKAKDIELDAEKRAKAIVAKAEKEAQKLIDEARDEGVRMQESGKESLKQAGRDLIIALRKEIADILDRIIALRVRDELTPNDMAKIISTLIKNYENSDEGGIIVSLGKDDLEAMEKSFLAKLKEETKKKVILRKSDDIQGGFIISYDAGKSHYDFTDKALADYLSQYLKPKLSELLKTPSSTGGGGQ